MYFGRHDIKYWPYAWRPCALSSYLSVAALESMAISWERHWLTCWIDDGDMKLACSTALSVSLLHISLVLYNAHFSLY